MCGDVGEESDNERKTTLRVIRGKSIYIDVRP